jgi:DNA polymerase elongation subunit (family B)
MLENLVDIREYDVPYVVRCCIDLDIRAGQYYDVSILPDKNANIKFLEEKTASTKATPRVLAFDIECTKAPLKFPDAEHDEVRKGRKYAGTECKQARHARVTPNVINVTLLPLLARRI